MKNLLISGDSSTTTWDLEDMISNQKSHSLKQMVERLEFSINDYKAERREIYQNFYLNERMR